jgi:hypothetical protein
MTIDKEKKEITHKESLNMTVRIRIYVTEIDID